MAGYASHGGATRCHASGESTIAVVRADSRKLVFAGLTRPSRMCIAR